MKYSIIMCICGELILLSWKYIIQKRGVYHIYSWWHYWHLKVPFSDHSWKWLTVLTVDMMIQWEFYFVVIWWLLLADSLSLERLAGHTSRRSQPVALFSWWRGVTEKAQPNLYRLIQLNQSWQSGCTSSWRRSGWPPAGWRLGWLSAAEAGGRK